MIMVYRFKDYWLYATSDKVVYIHYKETCAGVYYALQAKRQIENDGYSFAGAPMEKSDINYTEIREKFPEAFL